jgi:hypothetical protein
VKRIRRQSHRQALIDACRLLGYTIEPASDHWGPYVGERKRYVVVNPVGNVLRGAIVIHPSGRSLRGQEVRTFRFMWEAAVAALEQEKVNVDALKPPREARGHRRAADAVPRERNNNSGA